MRYVGTAVVALLLPAVLVGCSDAAAPEGSPAPSASASTSATPSAPALPAEAKGTGPAAAKAFVRHYVSLINTASANLDARPLRTSSERGCTACRGIVKLIDDVAAKVGSLDGGRRELLDIQDSEFTDTKRTRYVRTLIRSHPGSSTIPQGA